MVGVFQLSANFLSVDVSELSDELLSYLLPVLRPIIQHCLTAFVLGATLFQFNLADFNIVYSFVDPLVPIHPIQIIELHTAQLHLQLFIKSYRIAREKVKIKWISFQPIFKSDECHA